jgi:carbamoylphosphate synthase small subunit
MGGTTFKLKFGHRGGNQPVKDLLTGKVEITSQNHGFCVDIDSLKGKDVELTHINLNDQTLEGSIRSNTTRRPHPAPMTRLISSMTSLPLCREKVGNVP